MMFADPPRSLYLLLIVATIIAAGVVAKYQSRKKFLIFLAAAVILLALFLVDTFIESPREEATRRVIAMATAAQAGDERSFDEHIGSKATIKRPIPWNLIQQYQPTIKVWDLSREDYSVNESTDVITIGFMAKGEASGGTVLKYVKAQFRQQTDGSWKLINVEFFNPATKQPEPLPGM